MPLIAVGEEEEKRRQFLKLADPDGKLYAQAVHRFFMLAAKGSAAKAPIIRSLLLHDAKIKRDELKAHLQHMVEHPQAEVEEPVRKKMRGFGYHSDKRVPTMKDFARMIDVLNDADRAEADIFKPIIVRSEQVVIGEAGNDVREQGNS